MNFSYYSNYDHIKFDFPKDRDDYYKKLRKEIDETPLTRAERDKRTQECSHNLNQEVKEFNEKIKKEIQNLHDKFWEAVRKELGYVEYFAPGKYKDFEEHCFEVCAKEEDYYYDLQRNYRLTEDNFRDLYHTIVGKFIWIKGLIGERVVVYSSDNLKIEKVQ